MPSILAISGSPSPTSKTARVLRHVTDNLPGSGAYEVSHLAVRDVPAEALAGADVRHPAILAVASAIAAADGVIVATPVYKAAYSGILKSLLDLLPQYALAGKVVLPLATGGTPAHVLAIDYALRPVLSSMGATHIVAGCFIHDKTIVDTDGGGVLLDATGQAFLDAVVTGFTDALAVRSLQAA
ncbi:NADPH-dependent FMN reductase [Catellatospora coxensis]|uniref:NADPH-dependent FMN reductase-like domain-containing protein n=1 Tax=Catellatospora coxensis TaxID=310354 RepID=A0A8J3P523_9ACTN|nr:NADPH-dependent FMN reductase [Catellatospora coxensis]GIG03932.1 hypothetical protein Cco03nite_06320 [Catellatospora coxensis]